MSTSSKKGKYVVRGLSGWKVSNLPIAHSMVKVKADAVAPSVLTIRAKIVSKTKSAADKKSAPVVQGDIVALEAKNIDSLRGRPMRKMAVVSGGKIRGFQG